MCTKNGKLTPTLFRIWIHGAFIGCCVNIVFFMLQMCTCNSPCHPCQRYDLAAKIVAKLYPWYAWFGYENRSQTITRVWFSYKTCMLNYTLSMVWNSIFIGKSYPGYVWRKVWLGCYNTLQIETIKFKLTNGRFRWILATNCCSWIWLSVCVSCR